MAARSGGFLVSVSWPQLPGRWIVVQNSAKFVLREDTRTTTIPRDIFRRESVMSPRDEEITSLLIEVRQQDYPLSITQEAASAIVECIRHLIEAVPKDDQVLVRGDYDLATSALCHPEGDLPRTNERRSHYSDREP